MIRKTLVINGVTRHLVLDKDETLATVLREHLLLTGCKIGCGEATAAPATSSSTARSPRPAS